MHMLGKVALVAAVTCSALSAGEALARDSERAPTAIRLSTAAVDFQDSAAVRSFYKRLENAAWKACDSQIPDLTLRREDVRCVKATIQQAVASLDKPLVTARHQSRSAQAYARGY